MPMYRDSAGQRYWFDSEPDPTLVRDDLILMTEEEAAEAEERAASLSEGEG